MGRYSKPQPSLLPDVDSTLQLIAQWSHIIVTDLTSAFYQIPLAKESMKYCDVVAPFKEYESTLDPLWVCPVRKLSWRWLCAASLALCYVGKIADDRYCSGNTPQELFCNWKRVLQALHNCNLRLSARKTIICPKTITILGWIWSAGSLSASPHRLNTLTTYREPSTVDQMRSFIGAYKVLSCDIPRCSSFPHSPGYCNRWSAFSGCHQLDQWSKDRIP